jgi:hypothetical protein
VSAVRLSHLLDRPVVTDAGRRLGRAFDLRARWGPDGVVVEALVVGRPGLLERYGLRHARWSAARREPGLVPYAAVLDLDGPDGTIVVAEGLLGRGGGPQNA